ncbi:hypothetical protein M8818_004568 [Zalaria obscura]|uniref:Uncharacterized protein n=1 Tax=Zalaria obscura TaxID=2024903 RepID=A0ACC3SFV6_9PEZI
MRSPLSLSSLTWLLLATSSQASYVVDSLSFGHNGPKLSPNLRAIPGWHLSGENHNPQILSDRIILTPPTPGSTRGAIWAEDGITHSEWQAEIEFRASGQERGSGNLQVWFVRDGRAAIGQNSVYTVGSFDGLALVVDQYGGRGGGIRGFLNDGTTNFNTHHSVDSLAFGHCDYSYRNLGRTSKLRITNSAQGFSVSIDDQTCFSSDKIQLPNGYFFGVSAASAENPDSFELMSFVTSTTNSVAREEPNKRPSLEKLNDVPQHFADSFNKRLPDAPEQLPDNDASQIRNQDEQFADLHNRLQGLTHQLANIFGEFDMLRRSIDEKHSEISGKIASIPGHEISTLSRRVENIERTVQRIQRDVEGRDYKEHLSNLQQAVEGVKGGLTDVPATLAQSKPSLCVPDCTCADNSIVVTGSAPRMGMFVFVVIAVQVMMAGAYLVYKKRRDNAPKKYL